jgi:bifunctional oligoribonuclease and PAP phosphatase NrnA
MTTLSLEVRAAADAIRSAEALSLACHVTPDGDALGSLLGMHHLAQANGMYSVASWPEPFAVGHHYRSIPGLDLAVPAARFPPQPRCMVTFDCGDVQRLNELGAPATWAAANSELIVLDHHASNDRYGSINVVDTSAAATAVVVRTLASELGWSLTREAAWCLYVGLVTDTGRFQYASTTPEVFALAEELSSFDLPVARLNRELFEEHRFAYLQLAARALARAELDPTRRFVATWVSKEELASSGVRYEEVEGLIDWVRSTSEAEVACVCKEAHDGVRVSLRAQSEIDVGAIAVGFGGGGHRLAAGFTMLAPIAEVIEAVRRAIPVAVPAAAT